MEPSSQIELSCRKITYLWWKLNSHYETTDITHVWNWHIWGLFMLEWPIVTQTKRQFSWNHHFRRKYRVYVAGSRKLGFPGVSAIKGRTPSHMVIRGGVTRKIQDTSRKRAPLLHKHDYLVWSLWIHSAKLPLRYHRSNYCNNLAYVGLFLLIWHT